MLKITTLRGSQLETAICIMILWLTKIVVIFIDHYYGITISVLKFIFLQMYVQSYIIFLTN